MLSKVVAVGTAVKAFAEDTERIISEKGFKMTGAPPFDGIVRPLKFQSLETAALYLILPIVFRELLSCGGPGRCKFRTRSSGDG